MARHQNSPEKNNSLDFKNISCRYCKSTRIIKKGKRKTKQRGSIQRYKCRDCNRRFVIDNGFHRMRNNEKKITLCLDLYFRGISLRRLQEHLKAFYPNNSSHVAIYDWITRYPLMISKFTNDLKINPGIELQSDEMEYHRRKEYGGGVEQNWFVDVMDTKNRYIVSSKYIRSRTMENMIKILKKAKEATGDKIEIVTTDGLKGYPRALRKSFGLNKMSGKSKIKHNIVIASERGFNHKIERLHNSIRERTKTMRGFHGCIESANAIMKGYEIYYNFIRKHQTLEKTPAEKALQKFKLGNNKWLELIRLSKKSEAGSL